MPGWAITLISVAASALVSGIVGYLVKRSLDRYFKKKDDEQLENEENAKKAKLLHDMQLRSERKQDVMEAIEMKINPIHQKLDAIDTKISKVEDGALSGLRNDILTCYYRCVEKGYRGDWDYENIHHMFEAYRELNGNSFVADVVARFDKLPVKEEKVRKTRKTSTKQKNEEDKK